MASSKERLLQRDFEDMRWSSGKTHRQINRQIVAILRPIPRLFMS